MNNTFRVAAMLGVLMGAAPLAQAANASLWFVNDTGSTVRVEIYFSDVTLPGNPGTPPKAQKKATIRNEKGHEFKFSASDSNCRDKGRKFGVYTTDAEGEAPNHLVSFGEFVFEGTGSCKSRLGKLDIVQLDRRFFVEKWRTPVDAKNAKLMIHGPMGQPND